MLIGLRRETWDMLTPIERCEELNLPAAGRLRHRPLPAIGPVLVVGGGRTPSQRMALHRGSRTGRLRGNSMASRLQLNGWRRLWLAASAGLALWFVVVWPLQYVKDIAPNRHEYDLGIESDFESGRPLEMLQEPAYGTDCLHIYLSRKFDNTVPYTIEAYAPPFRASCRRCRHGHRQRACLPFGMGNRLDFDRLRAATPITAYPLKITMRSSSKAKMGTS